MNIQHEVPPSQLPLAEIEDAEVQIQEGARRFLQFFQSDPGGRACIDRALRQHLQGGVGLETGQKILSDLTAYAGEDVAQFVLMALISTEELVSPDRELGPDETGLLALVEKYVGPEAWSYLCGLMALYSADLKEAFELFGQTPQGWRTINRRVYFDHVSDMWRVTLEIIKYNGERAFLDETPSSAIILCQAILDALGFIPAEVAQQVADRDAVEGLAGLAYVFIERFAPDLLEEGES